MATGFKQPVYRGICKRCNKEVRVTRLYLTNGKVVNNLWKHVCYQGVSRNFGSTDLWWAKGDEAKRAECWQTFNTGSPSPAAG